MGADPKVFADIRTSGSCEIDLYSAVLIFTITIWISSAWGLDLLSELDNHGLLAGKRNSIEHTRIFERAG